MNINSAINFGCDTGCSRLDSELILADVLKCTRIKLYTYDVALTADQETLFLKNIARRQGGEPTSHIIHRKDFWKSTFYVNQDVLTPRPESELLVELGLEHLSRLSDPICMLELGVGSGAIIASISNELSLLQRNFTSVGIDISEKALAVAERNIGGLTGIKLLLSDWFSNVSGSFDLIIANPPYLSRQQSYPPELSYEPQEALYADNYHDISGFAEVAKIITAAPDYLTSRGVLLVEIDPSQKDAAMTCGAQAGFNKCEIVQDLLGNPRIVVCHCNQPATARCSHKIVIQDILPT